MDFEIWHYWIIATILFFLLEIFIPSFLMASIGIGCVLAFVGAVFKVPFSIQIILFIVGTLAGIMSVKPMMKKYAYSKKAIKTNAGGLVGRIGKVKEEINEAKNTGCVAIDGDLWKSITVKNQVIPIGEKVRVISIDSIILTVELLEETHPIKSAEIDIPEKDKSERLTLKVGNRTFFIGFNEIAFLFSSNKITNIVTTESKQYIHDLSLETLNDILPAEMFFRANRQFIVTRNVISEIKPMQNGKLSVHLSLSNGFPNSITVSRLKAAAFRDWLKN
ncbi:MAG: LytTR family transcriptional regulator DNA-binding domain-containing protein [Draconibacterium sp.]